MKRIGTLVAVLAVVGLAGAAQAQDEYLLQYKQPKPGEPVILHTIAHIAGTLEGMGIGSIKMTQKMQQWMKGECLETDEEGNSRVRMTFERMAMDMVMGAQRVHFDSAEPPSSQPAQEDKANEAVRKSLAGMYIGKGLTATMTPEGKCLKIEGVDEMFEGMKDMPGGGKMAQAFKDSMKENALKDEWFGRTGWLPKKPVRVGEVWSSEQRMKIGPLGEVLSKTRNKLLSVETVNGRRIARVGQTMNMEMTPDLGSMGIPGAENVQMKMISQGGAGTWLWDLDKGYMIKMQQNAPLEMTAKFGSTTQPSASLGMTAKVNYSQVMEVVGDEAAAKLLPTDMPKTPATEPATSKLDAETAQPATTK